MITALSQTVLQVKVQTWVDGVEASEFVGVGARFGTTIASKEKNAQQTRLILSDPRDCCSKPKKKVLCINYILLTFAVTHIKHINYMFVNINFTFCFFAFV